MNDLFYNEAHETLKIDISLCDWDEEARPDEIFGVSGNMIFSGVRLFECKPDLRLLQDLEIDIRIYDMIHFHYKPELDIDGLEGAEIFLAYSIDPFVSEIVVMSFVAESFEWEPYSKRN